VAPSTSERVIDHLWRTAEGETQSRLYVILDAARDKRIYQKLAESDIECVPLHRGEKAKELATVGPYLVKLERNHPFTAWLFNNGWGKSWGIFVESSAGLNELKRHFQNFLMVYDEKGKPLYFRYYDPRVFRVYLPTCNVSELGVVFGPVNRYFVEGENNKTMIEFSFIAARLAHHIMRVDYTA
jgi:hypothetical protein